MSWWRYQSPAYSPLALDAIGAAWGLGASKAGVASEVASAYGVPAALLTDSGTSALATALRVAALRCPGRACALPAYGCFDLVSAALSAGVRIVLYDIDPASLGPDLGSLEQAVRSPVAAIVVVHHYGVPAPLEPVRAIASRSGALLVDDAAQGVGARSGSAALGAGGDLGVVSFGRGKGLTSGGGGALLHSQGLVADESAKLLAAADERGALAFALKLTAQALLSRPLLYGLPARLPFLGLGETAFREPRRPRAMPHRATQVLSRTLRGVQAEAERRRENVARLRALAGETVAQRIPRVSPHDLPGWLRLPLVGDRTDRLVASGRRLGAVPGYPISLAELPEARSITDPSPALPGARMLARRLWTLPTHSRLEQRDLEEIAHWVRGVPA